MNTFLLHAKTIEEEKKRSKALADLNRQKVLFFQGISNELKSIDLLYINFFFSKIYRLNRLNNLTSIPAPLTLMLSPLDDIINTCPKEAPIMSHLQIIRRNSYRLLKLINSLLQVSYILKSLITN